MGRPEVVRERPSRRVRDVVEPVLRNSDRPRVAMGRIRVVEPKVDVTRWHPCCSGPHRRPTFGAQDLRGEISAVVAVEASAEVLRIPPDTRLSPDRAYILVDVGHRGVPVDLDAAR